MAETRPRGSGEAFYESGKMQGLIDHIAEVLAVEAPITVDLLARRIMPAW